MKLISLMMMAALLVVPTTLTQAQTSPHDRLQVLEQQIALQAVKLMELRDRLEVLRSDD